MESHVDIAELKSKSIAELHEMAEELQISNYSGLRKQDLIFRIEQNLLDSDVVLRGEGVLEVLPRGTASSAPRTGTTSTAPTTSTSRRRRSSGSTCGPGTRSWVRSGRPRRGSGTWPC
jgi:transcription termination factor Rho